MTVFIVVHSGGAYSDAYHNNLTVFLTQEEAESHIAEQNRLHDLFEPYSFTDYDYTKLNPWFEQWEEINGKYNAFDLPAGTPNRRTLVSAEHHKALHARLAWAKAMIFEKIDAGLASSDCPLSDEQRAMLATSNYQNPVASLDDCSVEDVELVAGSALWRILSEQQEKEKSE